MMHWLKRKLHQPKKMPIVIAGENAADVLVSEIRRRHHFNVRLTRLIEDDVLPDEVACFSSEYQTPYRDANGDTSDLLYQFHIRDNGTVYIRARGRCEGRMTVYLTFSVDDTVDGRLFAAYLRNDFNARPHPPSQSEEALSVYDAIVRDLTDLGLVPEKFRMIAVDELPDHRTIISSGRAVKVTQDNPYIDYTASFALSGNAVYLTAVEFPISCLDSLRHVHLFRIDGYIYPKYLKHLTQLSVRDDIDGLSIHPGGIPEMKTPEPAHEIEGIYGTIREAVTATAKSLGYTLGKAAEMSMDDYGRLFDGRTLSRHFDLLEELDDRWISYGLSVDEKMLYLTSGPNWAGLADVAYSFEIIKKEDGLVVRPPSTPIDISRARAIVEDRFQTKSRKLKIIRSYRTDYITWKATAAVEGIDHFRDLGGPFESISIVSREHGTDGLVVMRYARKVMDECLRPMSAPEAPVVDVDSYRYFAFHYQYDEEAVLQEATITTAEEAELYMLDPKNADAGKLMAGLWLAQQLGTRFHVMSQEFTTEDAYNDESTDDGAIVQCMFNEIPLTGLIFRKKKHASPNWSTYIARYRVGNSETSFRYVMCHVVETGRAETPVTITPSTEKEPKEATAVDSFDHDHSPGGHAEAQSSYSPGEAPVKDTASSIHSLVPYNKRSGVERIDMRGKGPGDWMKGKSTDALHLAITVERDVDGRGRGWLTESPVHTRTTPAVHYASDGSLKLYLDLDIPPMLLDATREESILTVSVSTPRKDIDESLPYGTKLKMALDGYRSVGHAFTIDRLIERAANVSGPMARVILDLPIDAAYLTTDGYFEVSYEWSKPSPLLGIFG